MGTLMQLLLEALRANVDERRSELRPMVDDQLPDEMSGFILENVHVATMPYIEADEDGEPPNPLLRLIPNRERPQREQLWLAPAEVDDDGASYEDSEYYPEDDDDGHTEPESPPQKKQSPKRDSHASKSKSPPRDSPKRASRVVTRPIRLEKEERSCLARLLFSRCWTGKDHSAGWKIKRRCPTGHKTSLSCPCGQIGPCRKLKQHPIPIDKMKSTNKKRANGTASSGGSKSSPKPTDPKNQMISKDNTSHPESGMANGKPFYEKLFPCCFKEHKHTKCCCRCKDNPPLNGHRKSAEVKKTSASKVSPKSSTQSHTSGKKKSDKTAEEEHSGSPSEEEGDDVNSDYYDEQSGYETFTVRSVTHASLKNHEKINQLSRKLATGDMHTYKSKELTRGARDAKKQHRLYTSRLERKNPVNPNPSAKSTTSFQIMLHPDISNDRIVEPEMVSHQILKTLSTVHGPVKVEQKIVVQGSTNSVVIVTHGEACQCNLCSMLKGKMHPTELIEGLSPQVVRISTENGSNTLINHSDGCKCDLCLVLDPVVASTVENRVPRLKNENLAMAASTSIDDSSGEKPIPDAAVHTLHSKVNQSIPNTPRAKHETHGKDTVTTNLPTKKSHCKTSIGKKKAKKCRCTKCRQRRRIEKLKLRLKKEMGSEEYNRIICELTRPQTGEEDQINSNHRKTSIQSDSDDIDYVKPKRKRQVSFSDERYPNDEGESEERDAFVDRNERQRRCKLCELASINMNQTNGAFKMKDDSSKSRIGPNYSTVYSMNASSHSTPCDCHIYRGPVPKESSDNQFGSDSKSTAKAYHFKSEEQKCFPQGHLPKSSRENQGEMRHIDNLMEGEETDRSNMRQGSSFSGKRRVEGVRDDRNCHGVDHPGVLLHDGAFPQKFVLWSPGSRSNMATAYSSDSYYVPDLDEFPIVNLECEE